MPLNYVSEYTLSMPTKEELVTYEKDLDNRIRLAIMEKKTNLVFDTLAKICDLVTSRED
jgi:hypothetical protein